METSLVAWDWAGHHLPAHGHGNLWGDGNILKLNCGDDCIVKCQFTKNHWIHFVNFMIHKLHLSKAAS